ncbi:MAG TPA: DUF2637 domain-containing protein [Streptosporangiaceae bacterium]|nr:DUF2637 domain-containing protein [Streptosporangiaceae bacterium]
MTVHAPAGERRSPATNLPEPAPSALRILGVASVGIGVAALAAATFVLSYPAIHATALQADVAPRLARGYPLLVDAMLVIVLAAVLALRGAGLPSRLLSWVTLLAVLAAAAGSDALHAAGRKLPERTAAVTAAVLPWVLVFLAFALLLAMLRYARLRRAAAAELLAAEPDMLAEIDDSLIGIDAGGPDVAVLSPVLAADDGQAEPDMPMFHRILSSPTPPAADQ